MKRPPRAPKGSPLTLCLRGSRERNLSSRVHVETRRPKISETTASTRKTTNKIFATPAALAAMPPKPKIAAKSAITKNTAAQCNMIESSGWRPSALLSGDKADSVPDPETQRIAALSRVSPQPRGGGAGVETASADSARPNATAPPSWPVPPKFDNLALKRKLPATGGKAPDSHSGAEYVNRAEFAPFQAFQAKAGSAFGPAPSVRPRTQSVRRLRSSP